MTVLLALMACNNPCNAGPKPTVELGFGELSFQPAEPEQVLDIVYGQQGGFHLDLAIAATHMDASDLVSATLIGQIDGENIAEGQPWFGLECDAASNTQQAAGLRLIFYPDVIPPDIDQQTIDVGVTILDSRGETAMASRSFVINDPL